MQLQRFNDKGIAVFKEYLTALKQDKTLAPPFELLKKTTLTEPLAEQIEAESCDFENRMDFVRWLDDAAKVSGSRIPLHDIGFWSWLSLLLFNQVCPEKKGKREPGELARHILNLHAQRWYRHLLNVSFRIFYMHRDRPERVRFLLLNSPLSIGGELTSNIVSRQELISCPRTMDMLTHLFVDPETHKHKAGVSGDAAARLGKLLNQYTRTWDIAVMKSNQTINLLPSEFDRFKPENI